MNPYCLITVTLLALVLGAPLVGAAEVKHAVTAAQAKLLNDAAKAEPAAALAVLTAYQGGPHALITLALAQTYWRLASANTDEAQAHAHRDAAERSYLQALTLDPGLRNARLGLAQCAAARDDWKAASREAAAGVEPMLGQLSEVTFLANAALRAGDWRLAGLAAQQGILRFPDDVTLRRIEVSVLQHAGRGEDVREAVLALLSQTPDDADLWRRLAWAAQQTKREDEMLAALEAAVVLQPDDRALRRSLADLQLGRGMPHAALAHFTQLIGASPAADVVSDAALVLSASRAATEAGNVAQGRAWIAAVSEENRTRALRLQSARLAVQAGDQRAAMEALNALIALGERDPSVLTWAGSLAEGQREFALAEALYLKAGGGESASASAPVLRLVALYLKQERIEDARSTLATHLVKRPDDQQARALQAQLERRRRP